MDEELLALGRDLPAELIGITEFAQLAGLTESRAAQMRRERQQGAPGVPEVVAESGRVLLHHLGDLVDWVVGSERLSRDVDPDRRPLLAFRLERALRAAVDAVDVVAARRLLVAAAIVVDSENTGSAVVGYDGPSGFEPLRAASEQVVEPWRRSTVRTLLDGVTAPDAGPSELDAAVDVLTSELARLRRVADADDYVAVVDDVVTKVGENQPGVPHRTLPLVAALVAVLLDVAPGAVVVEPTAGECEIMLHVGRLVGASGHSADLRLPGPADLGPSGTVRDRSLAAIELGRGRLALYGLRADVGFPERRGADRLVIDAGEVPARADLDRWSALLAEHGRAVVVLLGGPFDGHLASTLPPSLLVVLPARVSGTSARAPVVLWVADVDSSGPCRIVDLRSGRSSASVPDEVERRSAALRELVGSVGVSVPGDAELARLGDLFAAAGPGISLHPRPVPPVDDLEREWQAILHGRTHSASVIADNAEFARQLTDELLRLVASPAGGSGRALDEDLSPLPRRPANSPDGVLEDVTTDEVRRILTRFASSLRRS